MRPVPSRKPQTQPETEPARLRWLKWRGSDGRNQARTGALRGESSNLPGGGKRIDVSDCLICSNADDSWEAHGQAAGVARAGLQEVEGNFQNGVGFDRVIAAPFPEHAFEEMLGELGDLDIGEARV